MPCPLTFWHICLLFCFVLKWKVPITRDRSLRSRDTVGRCYCTEPLLTNPWPAWVRMCAGERGQAAWTDSLLYFARDVVVKIPAFRRAESSSSRPSRFKEPEASFPCSQKPVIGSWTQFTPAHTSFMTHFNIMLQSKRVFFSFRFSDLMLYALPIARTSATCWYVCNISIGPSPLQYLPILCDRSLNA